VPEILEVERYRQVAELALGRPVQGAWLVDARYGRGGTTARRLGDALGGRPFVAARRRGKLLLLDSEDGPTVGLRFGMTGALALDGELAIERLRYSPARIARQWVRAVFTFADGGALEVHDPRRLGSVELAPDESRLGPDALSITRRQLTTALAVRDARAAPLKARLMDQARVAGIGNLLADEILWRGALDPTRRSALTAEEVRRAHSSLRATLRLLQRRGGSHTGDLMEQRHQGGRCPTDGRELRHESVGGRTTYWCPGHQR